MCEEKERGERIEEIGERVCKEKERRNRENKQRGRWRNRERIREEEGGE